jgi:hypothetical protein
MSIAATPVARAVSTAFGLVMVASAAVGADRPGLVVAVAAAAAVLTGNIFRPAATIAVLLVVAVVALADAPPVLAATAGLCGAVFLVLRHSATVTSPTVLGAVGFTATGLAATSLPIHLPWVPLIAPLAVLVLYVLVTRPFWTS